MELDNKLPEPLTPADCDCTNLDGFMLNVERLMSSELVALSSHEVIGAAVLLWCRAWKQTPAASLPDDDRVNAAFVKLPLARFQKLKAEIMRGFVKCSDGRLYHKHLSREALNAFERKIEYRESTENKTERQRRWRERVKAISAELRSLGITPPFNASLKELEDALDAARASTKRDGRPSRVDGVDASTRQLRQGQGQGQGQGHSIKYLGSPPAEPDPEEQGEPVDLSKLPSETPAAAPRKGSRKLTEERLAVRKAFIDWWTLDAWPKHVSGGEEYPFAAEGARNGQAVSKLLEACKWDLPDAQQVAIAFLTSPDQFIANKRRPLFLLTQQLTTWIATARSSRMITTQRSINGNHRGKPTAEERGEYREQRREIPVL